MYANKPAEGRRTPARRAVHAVASCTMAVLVSTILVGGPDACAALTFEEAEAAFHRGDFKKVGSAAESVIRDREATESWYLLKFRAELEQGAYSNALDTAEQGVIEYYRSIRLRWAVREACLGLNDESTADLQGYVVDRFVRDRPRRYQDPEDRVVVGQLLLEQGLDPRLVLENVFDPLKERHPEFVGAYLASGDLALEKHDYAVAAEEFRRALELVPDRPDVLSRLARALVPSDHEQAQACIERALDHNPRHVDSLLFLVDHAIDREAYEEAEKLIERVFEVHPAQPDAWAYRAVIAHLRGDFEAEKTAREVALSTWKTNPRVEHILGTKLSQKYRFEEGAAYQRIALTYDPGFLPAKAQLCQDLLRLGRETEGWALADQVRSDDPYHVVAHNLGILEDHLDGFVTLEGEGIAVRMDPFEASIYGRRALDLLMEAKASLADRYGIRLDEPIVVEIFPAQEDFAIRTFGLPGGAGFLGVCFGNVITAQSPAAQGENPSNWEAVLWHEFCHVVTLSMTRNRMPRWLSEGISVYEERRRHDTWGQHMTPAYLKLVEEDGLTPLSELSGAFLQAPTPVHTQFAYYLSALAVEWFVETYGFDLLREALADLGAGIPMDEVLVKRCGPLRDIDKAFERFARARIDAFASVADWEEPDPGVLGDPTLLAAWSRRRPDNYWGLRHHAAHLVSEEAWDEAVPVLEQAIALCPEYAADDSAYGLLAGVYRERGDREAEMRVLREWTGRSPAAVQANLRLLELEREGADWERMGRTARRVIAANPLAKAPYRVLAEAGHQGGSLEDAVAACRALLEMDPIDPAELHYDLAQLLQRAGRHEEARRSLLMALAEAPRFRDAYRSLLIVIRELEQRTDEAAHHAASPPGEPG